jgi:hypothetical protein
MNFLRCLLFMQFATTVAFAQPTLHRNQANSPTDPGALVRRLYHEVVLRHPVGIPRGAEMRIFAPYLSKALIHKIDLFLACDADWLRQNPEPHLKAPFGVWESGLFSGVYERTEPKLFQIERTQLERDGSFRVYVKLTYDDPPGHPQNWRVAAIVVKENGHYAVDDVIYLNDKDLDVESRLSEALSTGCDGAHWKGDGNR